jgi:prophage maintenance system killer protein
MRQLLNWWQENDTRRLHTLIQAAELHERLVSLHPFADGNGRTARLLMNLVLLQGGYAAANIAGDRDNRLTYYAALEKCNLENDKDDFISFIINCEKRSIQKILQTAGEFPLKDSMPPFIPTESMPDTAFFDGMEFVFIEEGEFLVNPYDEDDQQTVNEGHRVKIRPGFWIGKKPVSREQWEKIMGTDWNPHENFPGKNNEGPINNEEPIINVDWNIIQKFIEKLNEKNCGQDADSKTVWQNKLHNCYRLPTETEWKFALQNEQICTELQETVQKKSCDCWLEWTMDAYSDCRYITKHDPALNPINDSWTPDGELVLTGIQTGTPTPYKRTFAREKCSSDSIGFRLVRTVSED